jgi:hypothetical protein
VVLLTQGFGYVLDATARPATSPQSNGLISCCPRKSNQGNPIRHVPSLWKLPALTSRDQARVLFMHRRPEGELQVIGGWIDREYGLVGFDEDLLGVATVEEFAEPGASAQSDDDA